MTSQIDPVCGVQVDTPDAAGMSEHQGTTYYFHSEECLSTFNQHPEQYAHKPDGTPALVVPPDENGRK